MLTSVHIEGFRGLAEFRMDGLGRVNLLVGKNNGGKTSVLEALQLLSSGDPQTIRSLAFRRGEWMLTSTRSDLRPRIVDISHMFAGHKVSDGSEILIQGRDERGVRDIVLAITSMKPNPEAEALEDDDSAVSRLVLRIHDSERQGTRIPLVGGRAISVPSFPREFTEETDVRRRSFFIGTETLSSTDLLRVWDSVALTRIEDLIVGALKFLDPKIERIAPQVSSAGQARYSGKAFIVKLQGLDEPVPIGCLGDGAWRMLALSASLAVCQGGLLLVDEIDTGLHYSVMSRMWSMLLNAAKLYDVQVFATTHSQDCVHSLAELQASSADSDVSVQRIELGRTRAVKYNLEDIRVAAEHMIEVR